MSTKNHYFNVLIVDDELEYREVFQMILDSKGFYTKSCSNGREALSLLEKTHFDLVLTDFIMPEMGGLELLKQIKKNYSDTEVIIITGYGSVENAVDAMREGAFTYIIKGNDPEEILMEAEKIKKIKVLENDNKIFRSELKNFDFMLATRNSRFKKYIEVAEKAADSNSNILILGESGVGKEVLARYIHQNSSRSSNHFMAVNCHAFSSTLLESELFGHEKGSFTGAFESRKGRFEAAHGGTLFLDEVGDIPHNIQVKLLRILESKKIERVGSNRSINVDFRLISATNKNLAMEISNNSFRKDLYYRLSTIVIEIPPLRERREDLSMLIDFFFEKSKKELKKEIHTIEKSVYDFLMHYPYPGNIRELKNIIERLVVLSESGTVRKIDLPEFSINTLEQDNVDSIQSLKDRRRDLESEYIAKVLQRCNYNITETAKQLMISRRQLSNKMNEFGLK